MPSNGKNEFSFRICVRIDKYNKNKTGLPILSTLYDHRLLCQYRTIINLCIIKLQAVIKNWSLWAGALVQWLWEETHVPKVVGSNPGALYWMVITFFTYICCNNCNVCLKRRKRGRGWPVFKIGQYTLLRLFLQPHTGTGFCSIFSSCERHRVVKTFAKCFLSFNVFCLHVV